MHNSSMQTCTELILESGYYKHILREADLAVLLEGSPARRYALVNKAIKAGELIRICRGYYTLHHRYMKENALGNFYIANRIVPFSFVSAESALSFHGLIPERVSQVINIAAFGRNKKFETPFGRFVYHTLPISPHHFYYGVELLELNQQMIYMATPLRALIDYIYLHKINHADILFLENSLRIETEEIEKITSTEIALLNNLYHSQYVKQFLKNLGKYNDKSDY